MMRKEMMKGFTFVELLVVVAVSGILMGIGGFAVQGFRDRYGVESQVRQMHADMMNARIWALQKNKECFVMVTNNGYQITEDTNESGGNTPDAGDLALWPKPKQFKLQSLWAGTLIMKVNGIISLSTRPLLANTAVAIHFDTAGSDPEYDCILVGPTRLSVGKWNGQKCISK
jgi:prepilin-type N-terminal cleavage/methylation domain-containing protein